MQNGRYAIAYDAKFVEYKKGGWTKEALEKRGSGGCDAFVFTSIIRDNLENVPHKGALSVAFLSNDGHGEDLIPTEMFTVIVCLASALVERNEVKITGWRADLLSSFLGNVRRTMAVLRELDDPNG